MLWEQTERVTNLVLMDADSTVIDNHVLTATEIQNATATFENLDMGVPYIVQIFYNEVLRGTMDVKTSGFIGSVVLNIPGHIAVENINEFLVEYAGKGYKKATIWNGIWKVQLRFRPEWSMLVLLVQRTLMVSCPN